MRTKRLIKVFVLVVGACSYGFAARTDTTEQLQERAKANPFSLEAREALAEAYLRQCELEKSLELWRAILASQPEHERARFVVSRLTIQALDLDSQLEVIEMA